MSFLGRYFFIFFENFYTKKPRKPELFTLKFLKNRRKPRKKSFSKKSLLKKPMVFDTLKMKDKKNKRGQIQ